MNDQTIELNCGNCGTLVRVHKPIMTRFDDGLVSTVMLVPSWSPTERKCPGCGFIIAPVFAPELPIQYVSLPPKEEPKRIVTPGPIPMDLARKLKTG